MDPNTLNQAQQGGNIISSKNVQDQKKQKGTGFSNINKILQANTGAGAQMGQRVAGNIAGAGQRVGQQIGQAQQQFQQGYQQSMQQAQGQLQQGAQLTRQSGESDQAYQARVAQNLGGINAAQAGEAVRAAQYQGPQDIQNAQMIAAKAQSASDLGTLARSNVGQGILARQALASPGRYTRGQGALDQLLMGQDVTAQRAMQEARRQVSTLGEKSTDAIEAARQAAQSAAEGVQTSKQNILQNVQKEMSGLQTIGEQQAQAFNQDAKDLAAMLQGAKLQQTTGGLGNISCLQNAFKMGGKMTPEAEAKLKRNAELINRASEFGLDLDKFNNIYMRNPAEAQDYINKQLAATNLVEGGRYFKDDQSKIGTAFSDFLKADPNVKKMFQEQFNKNVFTGDEGKDFSGFQTQQKQARDFDKETQAILQRNAGKIKEVEEAAINRNNAALEQAKNTFKQQKEAELKTARTPEERSKIESKYASFEKQFADNVASQNASIKEGYKTTKKQAQKDIAKNMANINLSGSSIPQPKSDYEQFMDQYLKDVKTFGRADIDVDTAGNILPSKYRGTSQEMTLPTDRGSMQYNMPVGTNKFMGDALEGDWLAYADRGALSDPNRIDKRFRGLGLDEGMAAQSGALRSSAELEAAAQRAIAQEQSLKQRLLRQYAGLT